MVAMFGEGVVHGVSFPLARKAVNPCRLRLILRLFWRGLFWLGVINLWNGSADQIAVRSSESVNFLLAGSPLDCALLRRQTVTVIIICGLSAVHNSDLAVKDALCSHFSTHI